MSFVGNELRRQRFILAMIKASRIGQEFRPVAVTLHKAVAIQIQAKFHASRMKARRPIQLPFRNEVMPL